MKKIVYGAFLFIAALAVVSCGKDSADKEILKYTTDNTLAIVKLNVAQLDKKLPKEQMLKDDAKFSADEKEKLKLFLDGKENGVDTSKPLYILADKNNDGFAFSFVGWVKDQAKFTEGFSKLSKTKVTIDDTKKLVYADAQLIGSVHDGMIVLASGVDNPMNRTYGNYEPQAKLKEEFYTNFWKREATKKETTIKQVTESLGTDADVSSWVNLHAVITTATKGYIETLAINRQLMDAGIGMNFNFGEGKIEFKANTFFNEELQKLVKKYYDGKSIDYNIVKSIDLDTALSYSIGNMSLDFVKHFIKEAGFEATVNNVLEYKQLTIDDITGALSGTYAFVNYKEEVPEAPAQDAAADLAMAGDEPYADSYGADYSTPYAAVNYPQPNMVLALGLNGDKAKKLIDVLTTDPTFGNYAHAFHNKEILVISSNEKNLELVKSGKAAANKKLVKKTGINGYGWAGGDIINDKLALTGAQPKVQLVNIETISKIKDGNAASETTINLNKTDKNVLYYLMGYE